MSENKVLVQANNIRKWFPIKKWFFEKQRYVKAVDDVTLTLYRGETLGIPEFAKLANEIARRKNA